MMRGCCDCIIIIIIIIIITINEQINVAFSTKTTRTRNIPKRNKKRKTTCSVGREKQAVEEQRSEPSVRHCEKVRLQMSLESRQ